MRIKANYFDGLSSQLNRIEIEVVEDKLVLYSPRERKEYALKKVKISDNLGSANLSIELPDGGRLECPGIRSRKQIGLAGTNVLLKFLERGLLGVLLSVAFTVIGVWICKEFVLPVATDFITPRIPEVIFEKVDAITLDSLDDKILTPSTLPEEKQNEIKDYFDLITRNSEVPGNYQLKFRATKSYLPNAFTLSGSTIILTDDLANLLDSKEQIGAILAHELGHEELGHVKKNLVRFSSATVLIALTTGDFSNTIAQLSTALWQLSLSRDDEFEADEFGVKLIKKIGGDPMLLATGLEKLETALREKMGEPSKLEETFKLISTHPETPERVKRISVLSKEK